MTAADRDRLLTLLDGVCDQRATAADMGEIEQIALSSAEARWLYLTYVDLHGTLVWDAASGLGVAPALESLLVPADPAVSRRKRPAWFAAAVAVVSTAILLGVIVGRYVVPTTSVVEMANDPVHRVEMTPVREAPRPKTKIHHPVELASTTQKPEIAPTESMVNPPQAPVDVATHAEPGPSAAADIVLVDVGPLDDVTKVSRQIDLELARTWRDMQVTPSPIAEETEWLRRAMLDLSGRIPTVAELEAFVNDDARDERRLIDKRRQVVDRLLDDGDFVRNFSTVWLNLLVGRSPPEQVDRDALKKYLRMSFAANKPWNAIVAELLSAEGRTDQNGATNYLVAHLNNQAVPATAITSRLFLGQQLQCVQCHNHPFNDLQQASFWELNSLFQQTAVVRGDAMSRDRMTSAGPRTGPAIASLVTEPEGGPIYYETTQGLMKVAFPRFNGQDVDPAPQINRRQQLAQLLTSSDQPQLATAFVNRTWAHFFGAGFTNPIDDMGPHNPPCHPEVLDLLRDEFIRSGYDIKQLIRWITATDAYQRASRAGTGNERDDPALTDVPLFSRVYPQPMSAEQLYDSLVTATQAHQSGATDWTAAEVQRQAWLEEFVVTLNNDENDEAETLSGTYSQALTLMNGDLMEKALDLSPGTFLGDLVRSKLSESDKIRRLCQAALSRPPTPKELTAMQRVVRKPAGPRQSASGYQDLFWALLNSNEFAIVH